MNTVQEVPAADLSSIIVRTPEMLGGKPRVKGHRVAVHRVAAWWKLGLTIEEIGQRVPGLAPAEIHAALAYYHLHRSEIESYLEEERVFCHEKAPPSLPAA